MLHGLNRRELLLGSMAALALAACGSGDDGGSPSATSGSGDTGGTSGTGGSGGAGTTGPDGGVQTLRSDAARTASVNPTGKGDALLPMSVGMYRELARTADPAANLVFSPISVAFALAMATNGAAGTTLDELLRAFGFASVDELNATLNDLGLALEARAGERQFGPERIGEVTLELANSLWGQSGFGFEAAFLDRLAAFYGAGLQAVDYRTAAEAARVAINEWVAEATRDKIPELIVQGVLTELTRLVLVNAVYLKAPWLEPFDEGATAPKPFTLVSGERIEVDMMTTTVRQGAYAKGDGWTAVELPYLGGELAMTVVVPDAGGWAPFEAGLAAETLGPAAAALEQRRFFLTMPKWTTRTSSALVPILQALGVTLAFDEAEADFSAMSTEEPLHISAVIQEAFIAVDEQGTEAAAATAVIVEAVSAPVDEPPQVDLDRPFLYAIRDRQTRALLFVGRVLDPRQD